MANVPAPLPLLAAVVSVSSLEVHVVGVASLVEVAGAAGVPVEVVVFVVVVAVVFDELLDVLLRHTAKKYPPPAMIRTSTIIPMIFRAFMTPSILSESINEII